MIVPFIFTLDTVGNGRQLAWVFNKAVSFSKEYRWPVIAQKQYFDYYGEDDSTLNAEYFEYDIPQPLYLSQIESVVIPKQLEDDFIEKFPSQIDAYFASVKAEWKEMEEYLLKIIDKLEKQYGEKIEAFISIRYYDFLNKVYEKTNIPVIYYEWGPFRAPNYRKTSYFDLKGLWGYSSIKDNYATFLEEIKYSNVPFLKSKEILSIFLNIDKLKYIENECASPIYELGIAAGYTTPSVTAPYNGITLDEMVYQSRKEVRLQDIGIRLHPGDPMRSHPVYGNIDQSELIDFILKSKRIVCNGSNIAYEAALYGRPTYDLGWSQFSFATNTTLRGLNDKLIDNKILNFVAFGSLIPYEFLNDINYLRFRLKRPSQKELYLYHLSYYLKVYGANLDILNSENRLKNLLSLRNKTDFSLGINPEFKKYYSFSTLRFQYENLKNKFIVLQLENENIEAEDRKIREDLIQAREKVDELSDNIQKYKEQNIQLADAYKLVQKELDDYAAYKLQIEKELRDCIANKLQAEKELEIIRKSNCYKCTEPLRRVLDIIKSINRG